MPKSSNDPKRPSDTVTEVKENDTELDDVPIKDEKKPQEVEESLKKSIEAYRNAKSRDEMVSLQWEFFDKPEH